MRIEKKYLIVIISILVVAVLATTYAFFGATIINTLINTTGVTTGKVELTISDTSVDVSSLAPIYNIDYTSRAYSKAFTVTNSSDSLNACAKLYLNITNISESLKDENFKYAVVSSDNHVSKGNFSTANTTDDLLIFQSDFIATNSSKTYTLYIWIGNDDSQNQIAMLNTSLTANVVVKGTDTKESTACEFVAESAPTVSFQNNLGGSLADSLNSVVSVADGYVVVGDSTSTDITGITNKGGTDAIIIKYDLNGNVLWQKSWGGSLEDSFNSVISVLDGYIAVGKSNSTNIDGMTNIGSYDSVSVKYDLNGNVLWQKNWGGTSSEEFYSVVKISSGYIAVGNSGSSDITGITNIGGNDAIIVKYDLTGNMAWQKNWGGSLTDLYSSITESSDGYVAVGFSQSTDITDLTNIGSLDAVIVKYDTSGNILWQKNWGGTDREFFNSVVSASDGYIVGGQSLSIDIAGITNKGNYDAIIMKYDTSGNILWQKNWGGEAADNFKSIIKSSDGYIVSGYYTSTTINNLPNSGAKDGIIAKYDLNGNILWQNGYGGSGDDSFSSVIEDFDGRYIIVGDSTSTDITGITNKGSSDTVIVKYRLSN